MKKPRALVALRLPVSLLERLEAIAEEQGITMSATMRLAMHHGLVVIEKATAAPANQPDSPTVPGQRRRILSRGIDG